MLRLAGVWVYRAVLVFAISYLGILQYKNRVTFELFRREWDAHTKGVKIFEDSAREQLNTFYRTLYVDPAVKPVPPEVPRQPSYHELWQQNRDAEFRRRLEALERWRLEHQR